MYVYKFGGGEVVEKEFEALKDLINPLVEFTLDDATRIKNGNEEHSPLSQVVHENLKIITLD